MRGVRGTCTGALTVGLTTLRAVLPKDRGCAASERGKSRCPSEDMENVLSWPILRPDFCPDFCPDLSCLRRSKPEMIWDSGWRKGGHRRAGLGDRSGGYSHPVFHFLVLFAVQCRVLR